MKHGTSLTFAILGLLVVLTSGKFDVAAVCLAFAVGALVFETQERKK